MNVKRQSIFGPRTYPWTYATEGVTTPDGWRLVVHRLTPMARTSDVPVLFVHGFATTAWPFFGVDGGIAGALAATGRDVFCVELRGSAGTRALSRDADVRVTDKVGIDLPKVLDHIQSRTDAAQVDCVGHSLGGVMLYLLGASEHADRIRRVVTIGSPLRIGDGAVSKLLRSRSARALAGRLGRLPVRRLVRKVSNIVRAEWIPAHFDPDHACPDTLRQFMALGVSNLHGPELAEMVRWLTSPDHHALLPGVRGHEEAPAARPLPFPTRFIVGAGDLLTTPAGVAEAFARLGHSESDLHVLGRAHGYSQDYRHADILVGRRVQEEVVPLVRGWLADDQSPGWLSDPLARTA